MEAIALSKRCIDGLLRAYEAELFFTHRVRRGDSLWSLSRKYDLEIGSIKWLNRIKGDSLKMGDRLIIRRKYSEK